MPVYLRKNVSYTPPSLDKIPAEVEDDFMNDPDLQTDSLPQPYRMIDKTLRGLLDETWDVIAEREAERVAEANKVRPPQYVSSVQLDTVVPNTQHPEKQKLCYATCMCSSEDGQYIFIGLPCGFVAIEAVNHAIVASWEEEGAEFSFIKSYLLAPQCHLVTAIDDMGIGRLFAVTYNKIFLIKVLNPHSQDSDSKILMSKIDASNSGDYVGTVMEVGGGQDIWLEIYKLPRDTWVTDLETIVTALKKKEEKEKRDEATSEETESIAPSEHAPSKADTDEPSVVSMPPQDTTDQLQQSSRPASATSKLDSDRSAQAGDVNLDQIRESDPLSGEYKFGAPQLIMKVKPPPQLIPAVSVSNLHGSCQKVEPGDVVATGTNVLFTQNHLDLRKSVFTHLHDNLAKYQTEDDEGVTAQQHPNFHFMGTGRMLPLGLEQASLEGRSTCVAVWWPGSTNFMQYSLIKTSKDIEFKADLVWPFTNRITCSAVSPDTNILAVGLENGNVVIWDRYMGCQRGVVNVNETSPVVKLMFLDPALYPQDMGDYPPYKQATGTYVLAMCANSALYTISTGANIPLQVNTILMPVEKDDDTITVLQPFVKHPDLLLTVTRRGDIQIRDCLQGNIVCQVQVPDTHEITSPWEPVLSLGGLGQSMYVKATKKMSEDTSEIDGNSSLQDGLVFVYALRSFPSLDEFWKIQRSPQPLTVHVTVKQRSEALLANRLAQAGARKILMQERWSKMKDEINNLHQLKEVARLNAAKRTLVTPGSVGLPVKPFA
ncbi:WD repeat-containing protein 93-like isoform X3 [Dreissena polymorpha]|uniref:WD repeat-containing protein 93-like isoform X3 n=1 Tax=Dreissena polymorpha TaxID=45954 RepID=UPI00226463BE|nr:WD repeat-containing protein 93-like isoform X3 [Dreissena polymorpha]